MTNYFNYIKPKRQVIINHPETYILANPLEINEINIYADIIHNIAKFYDENLSQGKIDYVYKDNNGIKVLPVKYKKENFPHLTGINFAFKKASEKFEYLKNGNNLSPMIIERSNLTIKKLKVLDKLPYVLDSNSFALSDFQDVKQANKLGFSRAIKSPNKDILIALHNFMPTFYQPKSLLNIKNTDKYNQIPENTILGIFREKEIKNGLYMETISLNKASLQNVDITTKMLLSMKKYTDNLVALRKQAHQQELKKPTELPKPKSRTPSKKELARQAFLRKRGLKRN